MYDEDAVIAKVYEIEECKKLINGFKELKDYRVERIYFQHNDERSDRTLTITNDCHAATTIHNFIVNEIVYYEDELTKLKQELKDL